jgi:hypothetical protein
MITLTLAFGQPTLYGGIAQPQEDLVIFNTDILTTLVGADATFYISHALYAKDSFATPNKDTSGSPQWVFSVNPSSTLNVWTDAVYGGTLNQQNNKQVYKLQFYLTDNGGNLQIQLRELWVAEADRLGELSGLLLANSIRFDTNAPFNPNDVYDTVTSYKRSRIRAFDANDNTFTQLAVKTFCEFKDFDAPALNEAAFTLITSEGEVAMSASNNLPYFDDFTIQAALIADGTQVFTDFGLALIRTDVSDNSLFFLDSFEAVFVNDLGTWATNNELDADYLSAPYGLTYASGYWAFRVDIPAKSLPIDSKWKIISFWRATNLFFDVNGYETHITSELTVNRCATFDLPALNENNISDYINTFPAFINGAPRERYQSEIKIDLTTPPHPTLSFAVDSVRRLIKSYRTGTNNVYDFYDFALSNFNASTGVFDKINGDINVSIDYPNLVITAPFRAQFGAVANLYTTDLDTGVTNAPGTSTREWAGRDIEIEYEVIWKATDTLPTGEVASVFASTFVKQQINVKQYDTTELRLRAGVNTGGVINQRGVICDNDPNFCFQVTSPDEPFTEWSLVGIDVVGATDITIQEEETFAGVLPQLGNTTLTDISQQYTVVDGVKRATGCINIADLERYANYELTAIRKRAADPTPPVVDCVTCGLAGNDTTASVNYPFIGAYNLTTDATFEAKACITPFLSQPITLQLGTGSPTEIEYRISVAREQLALTVTGAGGAVNIASVIYLIPATLRGNSYHVIITRVGNDANDWLLYLNGVLVEKLISINSLSGGNVGSGDFVISPFKSSNVIAFARIYNRALTPAEITALYNNNDAQTPATVGILPADIILNTTFNAISGTVATDNSPNLNDGTLNGWTTLQTDAGGGAWTCPVQAVVCTTDVPSGYCGLQFIATDPAVYVAFDGSGLNLGASDFTATFELSFDPCYYESMRFAFFTPSTGATEWQVAIEGRPEGLYIELSLADGVGQTFVYSNLCKPECTNNDAYLSLAYVRIGDDGTQWLLYANGVPTQVIIGDNQYGGTGLVSITDVWAIAETGGVVTPVVSNIRVYDRVLTPTEIAEQYATRNVPTGATGNVVYDIPFSEFQGTTATDVSGNGYDGTLVGFGSTTYQNGGAWTCPSNLIQQPIPNAQCDTVCGLKVLQTPAQSIIFPTTGVNTQNNNPITVNGWYKSEFTPLQGFVKIRIGSASIFIEVELRANQIRMRYFRTSAATQTEVVFKFSAPAGTCYHFAAIIGETRKANGFRLFINGVQIVAQQELQDDAPPFDLFNIGLGGLEITQDNPNVGSYAIIRNLSVDNFALNEAQINRIYNGGVPAIKGGGAYILNTSSPDLTIDGYQVFLGNQYAPTMIGIPFSEFEGTNANDLTQYGNDGTLNGYLSSEVAYGGGAWGCAPIIPDCPAACGVNLFFPPSPPNPFAPKSVISASSSAYYGGGNFTVMGRVNGLLNNSFGLSVNAGCGLSLTRSNLSYSASFTPFVESKFLGFQNPKDCYHVAVVRERQNGINRLTIYRDNEKWVFEMTNVSGGGARFFQFNHANLGNNTGVIASDWRFFDRPLTEIEVRAIMMLTPNTPLSASLEPNIIVAEADLILEYLFDQTSGSVATDTSGGGNNGTLIGYTPAELLPGGGAWSC